MAIHDLTTKYQPPKGLGIPQRVKGINHTQATCINDNIITYYSLAS